MIILEVILGILALCATGLLVASFPELRRYLRMLRM
jgi:hypothetical protein